MASLGHNELMTNQLSFYHQHCQLSFDCIVGGLLPVYLWRLFVQLHCQSHECPVMCLRHTRGSWCIFTALWCSPPPPEEADVQWCSPPPPEEVAALSARFCPAVPTASMHAYSHLYIGHISLAATPGSLLAHHHHTQNPWDHSKKWNY